jgi:23S rRNA pseudouridine2604 synthase
LYRAVTPLEYKGLKRLIADSSNQPVMPDTNKNHSDKKHTDKKYPDRKAK